MATTNLPATTDGEWFALTTTDNGSVCNRTPAEMEFCIAAAQPDASFLGSLIKPGQTEGFGSLGGDTLWGRTKAGGTVVVHTA